LTFNSATSQDTIFFTNSPSTGGWSWDAGGWAKFATSGAGYQAVLTDIEIATLAGYDGYALQGATSMIVDFSSVDNVGNYVMVYNQDYVGETEISTSWEDYSLGPADGDMNLSFEFDAGQISILLIDDIYIYFDCDALVPIPVSTATATPTVAATTTATATPTAAATTTPTPSPTFAPTPSPPFGGTPLVPVPPVGTPHPTPPWMSITPPSYWPTSLPLLPIGITPMPTTCAGWQSKSFLDMTIPQFQLCLAPSNYEFDSRVTDLVPLDYIAVFIMLAATAFLTIRLIKNR